MGMDTFLMEQAEADSMMREDDRRNARLVVAGAARDMEDCRLLLDALGLL